MILFFLIVIGLGIGLAVDIAWASICVLLATACPTSEQWLAVAGLCSVLATVGGLMLLSVFG